MPRFGSSRAWSGKSRYPWKRRLKERSAGSCASKLPARRRSCLSRGKCSARGLRPSLRGRSPAERADVSPPAPSATKPFLAAHIQKISPTTCELEWRTLARELQYKVVAFTSFVDARGETHPEGSLLPDVTIQRNGGDVGQNLAAHGVKIDEWNARPANPNSVSSLVAVIKNLKPDSSYAFRVLAVDARGETIEASMPLHFRTSTWWTHVGFLKYLAPVLVLLIFFGLRRSKKDSSPAPRPTQKLESEPKGPPTRTPVRAQAAVAKPIQKKGPIMREVEPGRYVMDLGEPD